jgi:hypothetical protein
MKQKQDLSIFLEITCFCSLLLSNLIYTFMEFLDEFILKLAVSESLSDEQILY